MLKKIILFRGEPMDKKRRLENAINDLVGQLPGTVGYVAKSIKTNETFSLNEDRVFVPASTIKLPILCAAYDFARRGKVSLDQEIPVRREDKVGGNGVLKDLRDGLTMTLKDLMILMIIISDNTATNLVIDALGIDDINDYFQEKGLLETKVERKMLDAEAKARGLENYISPRDLATVLEGLARKTLLHPEDCDDAIDVLLRQQVNTKMPLKLADRFEYIFNEFPIRVAHKTGDLMGIEHDVGIVFTPKDEIVLVILTEETDNKKGIEFVADLSKLIVDYFNEGDE